LNTDKYGQDKMSSILIYQSLPRILRLKILCELLWRLSISETKEIINEVYSNPLLVFISSDPV